MSTVGELDTILARLAGLDDEKLEAPLAKLLPRLLSPQMVGAQDAALRSKVVQILTHCNKRIKAAPNLQLPVEALLSTYAQHANPKAIENNFIIMYLDFGVPRLAPAAKGQLFGQLMCQIAQRPAAQQATLHRLLLNVAPHFALPTEEKALADAVAFFGDRSADLAYVIEFFTDVMVSTCKCTAVPPRILTLAAGRPRSFTSRWQQLRPSKLPRHRRPFKQLRTFKTRLALQLLR